VYAYAGAHILPHIGGGAVKETTRRVHHYCPFGRQFRNTSQKPYDAHSL